MTTTTSRVPVRSYRSQVPIVLALAFTLSVSHTIYITAAGLAPDSFNAHAPAAWAFYALGFGLAFATRSDRRWVWWTAAPILVVLIGICLFVYPDSFTSKLQNTFGWIENDVYTGLLMIALYLTGQRLRGTTLVR